MGESAGALHAPSTAVWHRLRDPAGLAVLVVAPVFWLASRLDLIAPVSMVLLLGLLVVAWLASSAASACWENATGWRLSARVGVNIGSIAVVMYAIGWGPTLAIGLLFGAIDGIRLSGSRAVAPTILWSVVAIVVGQAAIALDVAPTLIGEPLVDGLAALALLGVVFTIMVFGRMTQEKERADRELRQSEQRFKALVQHASDIIMVLGADGLIRYVSPAFESVLGYPAGSALGKPGLHYAHPDDVASIRPLLQTGPRASSAEVRMRHRDGTWRWFEATITDLFHDPSVEGWVANLRDVSERKRSEVALAEAQEAFRHAFDDAPIGIALADLDGRIIRANRSYARLLGRELDELIGVAVVDLTHPDDRRATENELRRLMAGEVAGYQMEKRYVRGDGQAVWVSVSASLVRDPEGAPLYLVGQIEDITERKALRDRLAHEAAHDPMTGLPNRTRFMDRLSLALRHAGARHRRVAVLFVDLDQFKVVNDGLGHAAGDQLLAAIADRLRRTLRPGDVVARFGGDEFTVLCDGMTGESAVRELAARLMSAVAEPITLPHGEIFITASVGIALSDGHDAPEALLRDADIAMYAAKSKGRARVEVFREASRDSAMTHLKTESELHRAVERREFELHYQPIVHLRTGTVIGYEALLRWRHPERGLLLPAEFIGFAEESGLIVPIGLWALERACAQTERWQRERAVSNGRRPLTINVNLSPRQVADPTLASSVARTIASTGVRPESVCLEITENTLMHDADSAIDALRALRGQGVHLSIDDFGTGYSSLSYLKRFPVEGLKIDRSFVDGLGEDPEDTSIVEAVVNLAHTLGITAVAEGVETMRQLDELRAVGADFAQGYLLGHPLPGDEVDRVADDLRDARRVPA